MSSFDHATHTEEKHASSNKREMSVHYWCDCDWQKLLWYYYSGVSNVNMLSALSLRCIKKM